MLGRAVCGYLSKLSLALGAALLVAPAACSIGFTATSSTDGPSGGDNVNTYDAGAGSDRTTTGAPDGGASFADANAGSAYEGSPLCNYSKPHGCFPDVPPQPGDCNLPDAGAPLDGGSAPQLACRVGYDTALSAPAPACVRAGDGKDGDPCQSGVDCAAGFECIGSGECRHYCCEDSSCNGSTFCDVQPMKAPPVAGENVPTCMPIRTCKLLMPGYCATGETCAVVKPSDGTTSCVATGPAKVGDKCDATHCAEGLVCLGNPGARTCFQLCHTAGSECPSGRTCTSGAPVFPDPSVGICTP